MARNGRKRAASGTGNGTGVGRAEVAAEGLRGELSTYTVGFAPTVESVRLPVPSRWNQCPTARERGMSDDM